MNFVSAVVCRENVCVPSHDVARCLLTQQNQTKSKASIKISYGTFNGHFVCYQYLETLQMFCIAFVLLRSVLVSGKIL